MSNQASDLSLRLTQDVRLSLNPNQRPAGHCLRLLDDSASTLRG